MDRDTDTTLTMAPTKVISLAGVNKGPGNRVMAEVRAYWEALRDGRDVPMRSDIDPRGIENALEYAFILERIAPGMARFRLAGMHLNELMGMEVRGMPLTAMFAPVGRKRIAEAMEACFTGVSVVEMVLQAETGVGKPPMTAKLLILPLKSDLGDVNRAIGCLIAEGPIGRTPRRFEAVSVSVVPVVAGASVQRSLPQPVSPVMKGFAESGKGFAPAPRIETPRIETGRVETRLDATRLEAARLELTERRAAAEVKSLSPEERRAMLRVIRSDS